MADFGPWCNIPLLQGELGVEYHEVQPVARKEAERVLESGDPARIIDTLLGLAYFDADWLWVQQQCLRLAGYDDEYVRGAVAQCLAHLARIHRALDLSAALPVLRRLQADPSSWVVSHANLA